MTIRQCEIQLWRSLPAILPFRSPSPETSADVFKALHGEEVGNHRDHHKIGGYQGRAIERVEIGPDIDQRDFGAATDAA